MLNQILNLEIGKIKPDPNQPRKRFAPETLESLSKNIKIEGVINPIEVDKDMVIVTGETRWRAAKIAGLTKVPVKIIDVPTPELRFRRQFLENIHNDSMDIEETAKAMKKYLDLFYKPVRTTDSGAEWLSKELGKSRNFVHERLRYLNLTSEERKAIQRTHVSLVNQYVSLPNEVKPAILKKMQNREFESRDSARLVISAIKLYPDYVDTIITLDYTGLKADQTKRFLANHIVGYSDTPFTDILSKKIDLVEKIAGEIMKLNTTLKLHTMQDIPNFQKQRITNLLYLLSTTIINFGKENVLIKD